MFEEAYYAVVLSLAPLVKKQPRLHHLNLSRLVLEIQALTDRNLWRHCPGESNPADLLTRGIPANELMKSPIWLCGSVDHISEIESEIETKVCASVLISDDEL